MNHCLSDSLVQFYDVDGIILQMEARSSGWTLVVRHRHLTGNFGSCEIDSYERLSPGELLDVCDAALFALLPFQPPDSR